ncbi:unnamed protein product [Leuciscus chuanchicus]
MSQIHGFSSAMKFIIFFLCVPLVCSELHKLYTAYTGINEQTAAGIQEFIAETRLDDQQIDYYDSNIKKIIPKQDWMEEFTFTEMWKEDTKIREDVQQIYKNNIHVIMKRFNQSGGVHMYQRMYGCDYDDKTEYSHGFDRYTYDGQEFITLGVRERRYTAHVPQAIPTVEKWNNDGERFTVLKQYYDHECVYWLKHFLALRKAGFERIEL